MSTVLFHYIVFSPCFWFLYFTSFQCLFSFMGLFIDLTTLFLVPLFILPFSFLVSSFCECEYLSLFVFLSVQFYHLFQGFVCPFFVCLIFFLSFSLFLSFSFFSALCRVLVLQPGVRPETSKVGDLSPGCWTTRELPTSWHINQWELYQRPPCYY